jgi:hypothetical protein
MWSMGANHLDASNQLVEKGANLFKKNNAGTIAFDIVGTIGPQVLQHAKDLRWASVLPLALLRNACSVDTNPPKKSANPPQRRSSRIQAPIQAARLAASVFGNPDIAQHMSAFFLRTEIIVRESLVLLVNPRPPIGGSKSGSLRRAVRAAKAATKGLASREGVSAYVCVLVSACNTK